MGKRNIVFTGWQHRQHRVEGFGPNDGGIVLSVAPGFAMSAIGISSETERLGYESADEEQLKEFAHRHAASLKGLSRVYGIGGTRFVPGGTPSEIDVPYLSITEDSSGMKITLETDRISDGNERSFNGTEGRGTAFLILERLGSFADLACHGCSR